MQNVWNFTLLVMVTLAIFLPTSRANLPASQALRVSGYWRTDEGVVLVTQSDQTVTATFQSGGDCPFGDKRTIYFEGQLSGESCKERGILDRVESCEAHLTGTFYRCTKSKELIEECNLDPVYIVPFEATAGPQRITGTYKIEHYKKKDETSKDKSDNDNDESENCKWIRDQEHDKEKTFTFFINPPRKGKGAGKKV